MIPMLPFAPSAAQKLQQERRNIRIWYSAVLGILCEEKCHHFLEKRTQHAPRTVQQRTHARRTYFV